MGAPTTDRDGVQQTYRALTEAGYIIGVRDGAGEDFAAPMTETDAIEEVMSCDDGYFLVFRPDQTERVGWVYFVFGNSPEEVICDYTLNLEHVIGPLTENWF